MHGADSKLAVATDPAAAARLARRRAGIRRVVWIGALIALALYAMIIAKGLLAA
ncbi:MAG TPA: hypothetical protein VFN09_10095 [Rhodanobacteraceae bacterium]|nr:hypothetical protein [Rhodanobacteraceae bacterium]